MLKITIPQGSYALPENWDEISLDLLIKLKAVDFSDSMDSNILYMATLISAMMGCNKKDILALDADSFKILVEKTLWVKEFNIKPTISFDFEFEGIKYGLMKDFDKISVGEQASIEMFMMKGADENVDKILAILIREVDENGNITPFDADTIDKRANVFRTHMKVSDVQGITAFFLDGGIESARTTVDSSVKVPMMQVEKM
jgi:hypothetical protein